ncbi:MAG: GPR endopeptidase [Clostridia bacterium]|nr:GPR endopeptidase [Clostridia bacterium]
MNNYLKTDMACEIPNIKSYSTADGIFTYTKTINNFDIIYTEIKTKNAELKTGRKIGKYATLYVGNVWKYTKNEQNNISTSLRILLDEFLSIFKKTIKEVTIIGLGNRNITSDSLGPIVIDKLVPTRHLIDTYPDILKNDTNLRLSLLSPGVIGQSGISSFEKVSVLLSEIKPDLVIIIDSLSSISKSRLCTTIQITDTGIMAGSGIRNEGKEFSKDTLGIPVISLGVPTTISLSSLIYSFCSHQNINISEYEDFFVSPNNCNDAIEHISNIIANALQSLTADIKKQS